jgi:heme a synthase
VGAAALAGVLVATHPDDYAPGSFWTWKSHLMVLLASIFLVAGAAWMARGYEPRRWVRWLMVAVLVAVIAQGALGGMRVVLIKLNLAVVHACFAQAFFCLSVLAVVVTSRWWQSAPNLSQRDDAAGGRRLIQLGLLSIVLVFVQLIAGALMRHHDAGLAIPDLPLAYGGVLPPLTAEQLDAANQSRVWEMHLPMVSLAQVWMHFAHRIGAVIVTLALGALIWIAIRRHRGQPALTRPSWALLALLLVQLTLGVLTVLMGKPADIATAHVAVGALLLVTLFVLVVRAMRLFLPRQVGAKRGFAVIATTGRPLPA